MPKLTKFQKGFLTVAMLLAGVFLWLVFTKVSVFAQNEIDLKFSDSISIFEGSDGITYSHTDIEAVAMTTENLDVVIHTYQFSCKGDGSWQQISFSFETAQMVRGLGYGLSFPLDEKADVVRYIIDPDHWIAEMDETNNEQTFTLHACGSPTPTLLPLTATPISTATLTPTQQAVTATILFMEPQDFMITSTISVLVSPFGTYKWHLWLNNEFCWGISEFGSVKLLTCDLNVGPLHSVEFHLLENAQEDHLLASASWPLPTTTPIAPTATLTNTAIPSTATPIAPTATSTNTAIPSTNTPIAPTATLTNTAIPSTNTPTATPVVNPKLNIMVNGENVIFAFTPGTDGWLPVRYGWLDSIGGEFKGINFNFVNNADSFIGKDIIRIWIEDAAVHRLEFTSNWDLDLSTNDAVTKPQPKVMTIYLPLISSGAAPQPTPQVASEG